MEGLLILIYIFTILLVPTIFDPKFWEKQCCERKTKLYSTKYYKLSDTAIRKELVYEVTDVDNTFHIKWIRKDGGTIPMIDKYKNKKNGELLFSK